MRMISFSWTSAALLASAKTVTRRDWKAAYADSFSAGEKCAAYDRQPRYRGRQIAVIELVQRPYLAPLSGMPDYDYEAEGLAFYRDHPELRPKTFLGERVTEDTFTWERFERWRRSGGAMYVVRFKLVEVC